MIEESIKDRLNKIKQEHDLTPFELRQVVRWINSESIKDLTLDDLSDFEKQNIIYYISRVSQVKNLSQLSDYVSELSWRLHLHIDSKKKYIDFERAAKDMEERNKSNTVSIALLSILLFIQILILFK